MNRRLQAADIVMTADCANDFLLDAIDAIEDHERDTVYSCTQRAIDLLIELHTYGPRISRAVDLVVCFLASDDPQISEIRKAQNNLVSLTAMGRGMACAS